MNKMNFFNKIFRKQNRFYIYTMIMVALFIIIVTTFSVYYMKSALERNNTVLLNEISQEGDNSNEIYSYSRCTFRGKA